jgi:hypothetical protein
MDALGFEQAEMAEALPAGGWLSCSCGDFGDRHRDLSGSEEDAECRRLRQDED